ncbi:MAG: beta-ketoacyl-ACP synthase III, partial [Haemophilus parainfluenzae]
MVSTSVVLVATGLDVPPYAVSNQVLVDSFNTYVRNYNKAHEQEIEKGILSPKRESDEEFIVKVSGIKSRYFYAPEGILDPLRMKPIIPARPENQLSFQAEKGMIAAKRAMAEAKVGPEDIDLVILACSNMQRPYPAVAVEIQHSLAIEGAAFDMNVACSSATFGIAHATDAIRTGRSKGALVISVEICSAHLNFRDRDSH